jgi:hypothetical protein
MLQNALADHRRSTRRSWRERRRYSGRTSLAYRIKALVKEYSTAIGIGASNPMMAASIERAAELQALAEEARAAAVRNGTFDPIALARIEGVADRAVRKLHLEPYEPPQSRDHLSLEEIEAIGRGVP